MLSERIKIIGLPEQIHKHVVFSSTSEVMMLAAAPLMEVWNQVKCI